LRRNTKLLPRIVNVLSTLVFLFVVVNFLTGWLGASPLRTTHLWTGRIAFMFLLASLTITPLRTVTGWSIIIPLRKTFGLNSFYWAFAHVLVFMLLIYRLDVPTIVEAFTYNRFIFAGAFAFIILIVLAFTTIPPVKKAVKKIWRKIHMWVYPANVLVLLHYSGATSGGEGIKPLALIAAGYLALLFILRLSPVKKAIIARRQGGRQIDTSSN
jgi:sulfoxide reductase heme-binding subunit YedZ